MDILHLREWIGRTETVRDEVTRVPAHALAAMLDRNDPPLEAGDELPPLWHWLYCLPLHRQSELAEDGHAKRGGFLPPVELPRRMWAGGRFEFHRPLRIGDEIERVSRISDVSFKEGRSGPLVFLVVRHEILDNQGLALVEEQDIVYRGKVTSSTAPQSAPLGAVWERMIEPGDVLLFRYSALTFNAHRIHYDRRYATEVESYPGLVVHGPLLATLLLDLLRRHLPSARVKQFSFRASSPLFDTAPFRIYGRPDREVVRLWAANEHGGLAMEATVAFVTDAG
jgi:3-methylfumaryl-CoA hydratase